MALAQSLRAAAVGAFLVLGAASPAFARSAPESFADLAEQLSPAVVNIATSQEIQRPTLDDMPQFPPGSPFEELFRDFLERQGQQGPQRVQSLGSGFVIDPAGIIVTNNHVIEGADEITVNFADGTSLPATVVGKDEKTDIAVLRVTPTSPLRAVEFGDSDGARVGDWVIAIGNPFGLGGSVSAGIVSARNRDINAGPYDDFIQTDAAINRGNSGGPLFNMDGQVVGVNSAIISPSGGSIGIGFSVPSNMVKSVVAQLLQYGETRRGWIGVRIQSVTPEIAEGLGLDRPHGALVAEVTPGGPAEAAGLQLGDLIVTFDGKPVADMRALPRVVAETEIGRSVPMEVIRNGQPVTLQVTLGRLDEAPPQVATNEPGPTAPPVVPTGVEALGMTLAPVTDALRQQFGIPADVNGVVITAINGNSPAGAAAAEGRVRVGDVIVEVAQREVRSPDDVVAKVKEVTDANGKVVLLLLNRGGELSFAAVRLDQS